MQRVQYGPDPNQFGHLRLPSGSGPHPLVIAIHGGFWRSRFDLLHMEPLCSRLSDEGLATWSVEYRRIGQPGGGWPGTADDVVEAVRYRAMLAREYPIDPALSVVIGFSAGGHLALYAASCDPSLRGIVSLAGVADLRMAWEMQLSDGVVRDFLGGLPDEYPSASPANLAISVPQRLVHGDRDETVPVEIARAYAQGKQLLGENVHLTELAGLTHHDLIDPLGPAWPIVKQTILDLLQPAPQSSVPTRRP